MAIVPGSFIYYTLVASNGINDVTEGYLNLEHNAIFESTYLTIISMSVIILNCQHIEHRQKR